MIRPRDLLPIVLLLLSSCGQGDPPPGGLTADQNAELDAAAQTLDAQRADLPKHDAVTKNAEPKAQ